MPQALKSVPLGMFLASWRLLAILFWVVRPTRELFLALCAACLSSCDRANWPTLMSTGPAVSSHCWAWEYLLSVVNLGVTPGRFYGHNFPETK